jgi:hypothetical protein
MNKRLTELEKLVAVTEEPIPSIEPWMSAQQAQDIWARALRYHNSLSPAFSEKEIQEACKGMTHEELAEYWAKICRETEEEVRREFGSPAAAAQADGEAD